MHCLGGNLARFLELNVAVIAGGQRPHFIDHVHQNLRAEFWQSGSGNAVLCKDLLLLGCNLEEFRKILDAGQSLGTANRNRFKILGTHHRTDAGASGGPVQIVDNTGIQYTVFTGLADGRNAYLRILMFGLDGFLSMPG